MSEEKTTDEHIFSMRYRNFVLMLFSIVVGTNTGTGLIFNQEQNTLRIVKDAEIELLRDEYNKERSDKKDQRVLEDAKAFVILEGKDRDIQLLEKELEYCKDK